MMSEELESNSQLQELQQKADEYLTGWKRAQADYQNLQKEVAAQRADMGKHAIGETVRAFLPVYDYFKRAMQHAPAEADQSASVKQWMQGAGHIASLFKMTLHQLGVQEMETLGKPLDPTTMEAVGETPKEGVAAGTVVEEVEGGYLMGDKVLKAARVIVAAEPKNN